MSRVPLPGSPKGPSLNLSRYVDHSEIVMMTLHIPQEKVADRYSTDEFVAIETSKRLYRAASESYVFLATLVAQHFTPVSKSLGNSFGLA